MKYYQVKCPECGQTIHVHRSGKKLFLKNICHHLLCYKLEEPLPLSSMKQMFNKKFGVVFNRDKSATSVVR